MITDYQIKVECPGNGPRVSCDFCLHAQVCQFKAEIFDEHGCNKHTINRLNLVNYVAMLCRHYNQHLIDWNQPSEKL
jgi:hypothetical protein